MCGLLEFAPQAFHQVNKTGKLVQLRPHHHDTPEFSVTSPNTKKAHRNAVIKVDGDSDAPLGRSSNAIDFHPIIARTTLRRRRSSPSTMACRRSDSFTRSSPMPVIRVVPVAMQPRHESTGYSSIIEAARSGGTSMPLSDSLRTQDRRPARHLLYGVLNRVNLRPYRNVSIKARPQRIEPDGFDTRHRCPAQ